MIRSLRGVLRGGSRRDSRGYGVSTDQAESMVQDAVYLVP